jgi:hypothetical protein
MGEDNNITARKLSLVFLTKFIMSSLRFFQSNLLLRPIARVPRTYAAIKNRFSIIFFFLHTTLIRWIVKVVDFWVSKYNIRAN